jgi:GNAT superfamily N-acetyltransferase
MALAAATRLVSQQLPNRELAARRFLASAPNHGIDLSLLFGTIAPGLPGAPRTLTQVALVVPGHGRTGMFFVSEPAAGAPPEHTSPELAARARADRVACINAGLEHLRTFLSQRVRLAQALPGPGDAWALDAFRDAGFLHAGDLAYLRATLNSVASEAILWPEGVRVVPASQIATASSPASQRAELDATLIAALERSYVDTKDCPELCGLRDTADILASHRATGQYDPRLWFLVFESGSPEGCMLLSRCPDQRSVELVYLGLSPKLRCKGLGKLLMRLAMQRLSGLPETELACAVDKRNLPALALYKSFGLNAFSDRVALVRRP